MRHAVKGRKLGRTTSHREAMFRNQLQSLVDKERIVTTLPKAKELRPLAEKVITRGKHGSVYDRRWVLRWVLSRDLVKKVFDEIAPRFSSRPGGYLRIVKLGPRQGDGAEMAVLELVERSEAAAASKDTKDAKDAKDKKEATPKKEAKPKKEAAKKEKPVKEAGPKAKPEGKKASSKREGRTPRSVPQKTG